MRDDARDLTLCNVDDPRLTSDRDVFLDRAERHREITPQLESNREDEIGRVPGCESVALGCHLITTNRQSNKLEPAVGVTDDRARETCVLIVKGHCTIGQQATLFIAHRADDRGSLALRNERDCERAEDGDQTQDTRARRRIRHEAFPSRLRHAIVVKLM